MKLKKSGHNLKLNKFTIAASIFVAGFLSYPFLVQNAPTLPTSEIATTSAPEAWDVCFTPNQSCLPKVVKYIDDAKSSILLLGYSFTSKPITQALINAKKRGVKVRIVLDHSQKTQKYSKEVIQILLTERIDVKFDHSVKIAHNKIMVIDNLQTLTGSYNWTHSAEFKNAENLAFIKSPEVAKKYTEYFETRWKVSRALSKKN
jgi:phosphatidylserine/phosphatidylglycerophosphate/cardiolipin synthase-like enzyme